MLTVIWSRNSFFTQTSLGTTTSTCECRITLTARTHGYVMMGSRGLVASGTSPVAVSVSVDLEKVAFFLEEKFNKRLLQKLYYIVGKYCCKVEVVFLLEIKRKILRPSKLTKLSCRENPQRESKVY